MKERDIINALVPEVFDLRQNFVCVRNVSFGLFNSREADLIVCTKSGFLTEVEVKVTWSDWANDFKKDKWKKDPLEWVNKKRESDWMLVKNFFYAVPLELSKSWRDIPMPSWAGVLGIPEKGRAECVKPCGDKEHVKLTDKQMLILARLGSMRAWDRSAPSADERRG